MEELVALDGLLDVVVLIELNRELLDEVVEAVGPGRMLEEEVDDEDDVVTEEIPTRSNMSWARSGLPHPVTKSHPVWAQYPLVVTPFSVARLHPEVTSW